MRYDTIFFDLDDTLYPAHSGLWEAILQRMQDYMLDLVDLPADQLAALRQSYLEKYGTTLRGLQREYHVNSDEYLAYVHDLPLKDFIQPNPSLRSMLLSLPQRRWVFTNADANHARRVMAIIGIEGCFEGIIDIRALEFACKPDPEAYLRALALAGEKDPTRCVLLDDAPRNLAPARQMGFFTVLVGSQTPNPAAHQTISSLLHLPDSLPELWNGRSLPQAQSSAAAETAS